MKKIMFLLCFGLLAVPVLSFADTTQPVPIQFTTDQKPDSKVQNHTKVQKLHDTKGVQNEKNEIDQKNEQYDKRLSVKF